jgi:mannitol-specific phosphotransferase system IIBC component
MTFSKSHKRKLKTAKKRKATETNKNKQNRVKNIVKTTAATSGISTELKDVTKKVLRKDKVHCIHCNTSADYLLPTSIDSSKHQAEGKVIVDILCKKCAGNFQHLVKFSKSDTVKAEKETKESVENDA